MKVTERHKNETAREYAYRMLRDNLISFELKPGSTASVYELSEQLGVSRTPVREALLELNRSGIIEVYPQRGNVVSYVNFDMANEARFLRMALERAIVERVCELATEQDLKELELCLEMEAVVAKNHHPERELQLDNEFHEKLFQIAGMPRLAHVSDSLSVHFDRIRNLRLTAIDDNRVLKEHQEILEAIRQRDKNRAIKAVETHLSGYTKEEQCAIKAKNPEYFA